MFLATTRPLTPAELDQICPSLSMVGVVKAVGSFMLAGPMVALLVAWGVRMQSIGPPARGLMTEWWAWAPWISAYTLALAGVVLGVAAFQQRRRRAELRGSVVTETRMVGDLAVAVWGLCDGELDVVVIRTGHSHAWIGEAFDAGCFPDSTSVAAGLLGREIAGKRSFQVDDVGPRIPLLTVEAVQEETPAFERVLRRHVAMDELPGSVRRLVASDGSGAPVGA